MTIKVVKQGNTNVHVVGGCPVLVDDNGVAKK